MTDCIFCKIINGDINANIIYQDDLVIAFDDINPKAPIHKLIIPRQHIATTNDITQDQESLVGHMVIIAQMLAKEHNIAEDGYRLVMNCNEHGGQEVFHIHLHLFGGQSMKWPPFPS
ncbi:MAG: histidine triad nucleotide-binding protein [Gammaproteobacteria bacterium]